MQTASASWETETEVLRTVYMTVNLQQWEEFL